MLQVLRILLIVSLLSGVTAFCQGGGGTSGINKSPYVFLAEPTTPEDWSDPKLDRTALRQHGAVPIEEASSPAQFTREVLRLQWRKADAIDLYVLRPNGIAKPPVILYLYGYPSETDRFRDDGWGKRATEGGYAAVGFVSAMTGDRYEARPMREWFVSELQEALGESTHDVQMVLDYLAGRGDLDMTRVGMFGQGSGGTVAILTAAVDPRIQVVDVLDPWGDWPDWVKDSPLIPEVERPAYNTPAFLSKVQKLEPMRYLPHLALKGLRVQQIQSEIITPPEAKAKISAAVPPADLVIYANPAAQRSQYEKSHSLWSWMKNTLVQGASRPAAAGEQTGPQSIQAAAPAGK